VTSTALENDGLLRRKWKPRNSQLSYLSRRRFAALIS
jgi:hypothetical protein